MSLEEFLTYLYKLIPLNNMAQQGKIKFFNSQKGFGFIEPEDGGKDVFVHRNNVPDLGPSQGLEENEKVEFEIEDTPKGKSAINVKSLDYE